MGHIFVDSYSGQSNLKAQIYIVMTLHHYLCFTIEVMVAHTKYSQLNQNKKLSYKSCVKPTLLIQPTI